MKQLSERMLERFRDELYRQRVTQHQAAAICGVSQSQFSKIIRGVRPMTVEQMFKLADMLGVEITIG